MHMWQPQTYTLKQLRNRCWTPRGCGNPMSGRQERVRPGATWQIRAPANRNLHTTCVVVHCACHVFGHIPALPNATR
eukprot:8164601-Lingulodinium_polyedra.AAC.1